VEAPTVVSVLEFLLVILGQQGKHQKRKKGETLRCGRISALTCGGPVSGNIQGQIGWGSEQQDPVEDVPAHCRGVGLDGL